MTGYGPLEPLLKDDTVTDILINTHKSLSMSSAFGRLDAPTSISRIRAPPSDH